MVFTLHQACESEIWGRLPSSAPSFDVQVLSCCPEFRISTRHGLVVSLGKANPTFGQDVAFVSSALSQSLVPKPTHSNLLQEGCEVCLCPCNAVPSLNPLCVFNPFLRWIPGLVQRVWHGQPQPLFGSSCAFNPSMA